MAKSAGLFQELKNERPTYSRKLTFKKCEYCFWQKKTNNFLSSLKIYFNFIYNALKHYPEPSNTRVILDWDRMTQPLKFLFESLEFLILFACQFQNCFHIWSMTIWKYQLLTRASLLSSKNRVFCDHIFQKFITFSQNVRWSQIPRPQHIIRSNN